MKNGLSPRAMDSPYSTMILEIKIRPNQIFWIFAKLWLPHSTHSHQRYTQAFWTFELCWINGWQHVHFWGFHRYLWLSITSCLPELVICRSVSVLSSAQSKFWSGVAAGESMTAACAVLGFLILAFRCAMMSNLIPTQIVVFSSLHSDKNSHKHSKSILGA